MIKLLSLLTQIFRQLVSGHFKQHSSGFLSIERLKTWERPVEVLERDVRLVSK